MFFMFKGIGRGGEGLDTKNVPSWAHFLLGGTGTGMDQLKVTHKQSTPMARVWQVFPGTQITKHHMCHTSLPPSHLHMTTNTTTCPGHKPEHNNTEVGRWGGGEKDEGGDGPSCLVLESAVWSSYFPFLALTITVTS